MTLYLLDTNVISDLMTRHPKVLPRAAEHLVAGDLLGLSKPVHYEILRGLFWQGATGKLRIYLRRVVPILTLVSLSDADWEQAARFWADARRKGKQFGDPDLLLAALAQREGAILVSADADFDALTIRRENWRL